MSGSVPLSPRSAGPNQAPERAAAPASVTDIVLNRAFALASEAAFLWESRSFVARSSAVTFEALARIDDRLSTLLRSLSKRTGLAERLLLDEPAAFRIGHAFVTAAVALQSGAADVFEELVKRLESDVELHAALASALAWPAYADVRGYVERLLESPASSAVQLGIVAAVAHRASAGPSLGRALDSEDPLLRSAALEAVGRLGAVKLLPRVSVALDDEDDRCRFWSAWSAVRLGDGAGIPVLGRFAADGGPFAAAACEMALRALKPDQAVRTHARLLSVTNNPRLGVLAAGIIGDPSLAGWLFEQMGVPTLARCAGAAFCLMTGRDLRRDDLDAAPPQDREVPKLLPPEPMDSGDADEPASASLEDDSLAVAVDADDELAWPDTVRLNDWWNANRHAFVPGVRHLAGKPIQQSALAQVMRSGTQLQRAAAATELALLSPDAAVLDVKAPAHWQIETSGPVRPSCA